MCTSFSIKSKLDEQKKGEKFMDKLIIGIKREMKRCFVDDVVTMSTHKPYAHTILPEQVSKSKYSDGQSRFETYI